MSSRPKPVSHSGQQWLALALRLKGGDPDVLPILLAQAGPRIELKLRRKFYSLNAEDVDDVLALSLYRVWRNRDLYDPRRTSLETWFENVCEHVAIDLSRCNWVKSKLLEDGYVDDEFLASVPEAEDDDDPLPLTTSQLEIDLAKIVAGLSAIDVKILRAHAEAEDGEHWAEELSAEIGMSAGAIRTRKHRIHIKIRAELASLGYSAQEFGSHDLGGRPSRDPIENHIII